MTYWQAFVEKGGAGGICNGGWGVTRWPFVGWLRKEQCISDWRRQGKRQVLEFCKSVSKPVQDHVEEQSCKKKKGRNSLNVNVRKGVFVGWILNIPCMLLPFLYVYTVDAILIWNDLLHSVLNLYKYLYAWDIVKLGLYLLQTTASSREPRYTTSDKVVCSHWLSYIMGVWVWIVSLSLSLFVARTRYVCVFINQLYIKKTLSFHKQTFIFTVSFAVTFKAVQSSTLILKKSITCSCFANLNNI